MANKKLIAGGIIVALVASITVVALIPVMMYGSGETLTQISMGMSTTDSSYTTTLSTSSIDTSQTSDDSFSPSIPSPPENSQVSMNAYEYFFHEVAGQRAQISNQEGTFEFSGVVADIDIYITFNLSTPSGEELIYEFNPQNLAAEGFDITLLLDSEDLNGETGTFTLEITIEIFIEVSFGGTTYVDENATLNPPSLDFTV